MESVEAPRVDPGLRARRAALLSLASWRTREKERAGTTNEYDELRRGVNLEANGCLNAKPAGSLSGPLSPSGATEKFNNPTNGLARWLIMVIRGSLPPIRARGSTPTRGEGVIVDGGSYLNRFVGARRVFDRLQDRAHLSSSCRGGDLVFCDSAYFYKQHPKFRQLQLREYTCRYYNDTLQEIIL